MQLGWHSSKSVNSWTTCLDALDALDRTTTVPMGIAETKMKFEAASTDDDEPRLNEQLQAFTDGFWLSDHVHHIYSFFARCRLRQRVQLSAQFLYL